MFFLFFFFSLAGNFAGGGGAATAPADAQAMLALSKALNADLTLGWSKSTDPCSWPLVSCSANRVTGIHLGNRNLAGNLAGDVRNLTALVRLELHGNRISGPLPSLSGLSSLQTLLLHGNLFSSIPGDFFSGLSTLQSASLDHNPLQPWEIPPSLKDSSSLVNFSANAANVSGRLPEFLGSAFPSLSHLGLAYNLLHGELPPSFSSSALQSLWLNNQQGSPRLSGSIAIIQNMSSLTQLWLQSNDFSGSLPDFSSLVDLHDLGLRDNRFTGIVPLSLLRLPSLEKVSLANNLFQGPVPEFPAGVSAEISPATGSFCRRVPGDCDPRVSSLLSVAESLGFPARFAESWRGDDPCGGWLGVSCDGGGAVAVVNFRGMGLSGEISPAFSSFKSLQKLWLSSNNLSGSIPPSLASLPSLRDLDLSNNSLSGPIPAFPSDLSLNLAGNPLLGKQISVSGGGGGGGSSPLHSITSSRSSSSSSSGSVWIIAGSVVAAFFLIAMLILTLLKKQQKKKRFSGKVQSPPEVSPAAASDPPDGGEPGSMRVSMDVLRRVTGDFSRQNILGSGGFGTVYRGQLHDGTAIAVKRMEAGVLTSKGFSEFKSEVSVLTKLRHRNLVSLLGYCHHGSERVLVYEFMPLGTLSQHLFDWKKMELKPLTWATRVSIALDVARGVEYLHSLAHQSFIHRDLKPSNILLGEGFRAKVADFGLVRLAPADGKFSVETRLAGTFGYLAPEYAVTGRVTTKADVFSFGVVLMELITGRKALDESRPEESVHLVTWFRRLQLKGGVDPLVEAVDPAMQVDEEALTSVRTVAELAGHCCAREPQQRPDMGHAVNVLSSLAELWKPADFAGDDGLGVDFDLTLPQALKKWQAFEGDDQTGGGAAAAPPSSSFLASSDSTQTSIPTRPSGFADSFTSADGR